MSRFGWFVLGAAGAILVLQGCGDDGAAGPVICSSENPDGECPAGQTCVQGRCETEEETCSAEHPAGVCPQGETCLEGSCVAEADLCSALNPGGICPAGRTCLDGVCRDDDLLCSGSNPTGLCDTGRVCLDGACVAGHELCSGTNPDGQCPGGESCVDGHCTADNLLCGPENPNGICAGDLVCVDGHCTDPTHACSPQHPDGTCAAGHTCLDGACVSSDLLCGPDNPDGLCPAGEICEEGECTNVSCDTCPEEGATRCAGDDVQTCERGLDDCLAWGAPVPCGDELVCAGEGECVAEAVAPVARLDCPLTGLVDDALEFDASASTDDVGIVDYRFAFGDGATADGVEAVVTHAFAVANTYTVTLTVEDGDGLTDTDSCTLSVQDDIPVNTPPTADFTVVRLGGLEVQVDGTSSWDAETADLELRWDLDDDGTWETTWSTDRVAGHTYPADDTYTIRLEVRDAQGETDHATRTVTVTAGDSPIYAPGVIQADATWSGTVIMANDVTLEQQATLTILPGTQVLVTGDYTLECNGPLMVPGTAGQPVLFTTYYAADSQPASWQGIVCYDGTTDIDHLMIEFGTACLTLWSDGIRAENVEARFCEIGIQVWRDTDLTWVTAHDNTSDGIAIGGCSVNLRNSQSFRNGASGIHINDWYTEHVHNLFQTSATENTLHGLHKEGPGSVNITECDFEDNGADGARIAYNNQGRPTAVVRNSTFSMNTGDGIHLQGEYNDWNSLTLDAQHCDVVGNTKGIAVYDAKVLLEKNVVSGNRVYGLEIDSRARESAVHQNNFHGNATELGFVSLDPQISLESGAAFVGTAATSWSTPGGELIRYFRYQITGGGVSYNWRIGSEPGGANLSSGWSSGGNYAASVFLPPVIEADTMYIELDDDSDTATLSIVIDHLGYEVAGATTELYCVYDGGDVLDLTGNYWGDPDPAQVSFVAGAGTVDLSGALASPVPDAGNQ